jgi:antitoxin (DNA-binding transcriptional repressor) of toxin-antitoxin stability system
MQTRSMQVSEFKAKCIAALRRIDKSGQPLVITLRGRPLARVEPIQRGRRLGALCGAGTVRGDIVAADFADDWESK